MPSVGARNRVVGLAVAAVLLAGAACAGDDAGDGVHPVVAEIPAAVAALDPASELYQVAGTPAGVAIVVRDGTDAVGYTFAGGVLSEGEPLGPADGHTFAPADVVFDPAHVLDELIADLDDPLITRFEVLGGPAGVTYTAAVLSEAGGTLLVDLAPDGDVLGVVPAG